jgi:hypothetical protein
VCVFISHLDDYEDVLSAHRLVIDLRVSGADAWSDSEPRLPRLNPARHSDKGSRLAIVGLWIRSRPQDDWLEALKKENQFEQHFHNADFFASASCGMPVHKKILFIMNGPAPITSLRPRWHDMTYFDASQDCATARNKLCEYLGLTYPPMLDRHPYGHADTFINTSLLRSRGFGHSASFTGISVPLACRHS